MTNTLEQDFQHFMAYTNSDRADEAKLRVAYEHGASRNERDAARYRWLLSNSMYRSSFPQRVFVFLPASVFLYENLDQAIDAAMQESGE